MKRVWAAKKFSYLYEARPGYMVSEAALSRRLGGLYCLYCLYETQPYKPRFKIYLSLGELKRLKILVIDAKQNGIGVVPALVKRMLDKNMLLFGAVDIAGGSITQGVDDMMKLQNKRVQIAYEKLLSNTRIEDHVHMDLDAELDLEALKKMSTEFAKAKESAVTGCSELRNGERSLIFWAKMRWLAVFDSLGSNIALKGSASDKMRGNELR